MCKKTYSLPTIYISYYMLACDIMSLSSEGIGSGGNASDDEVTGADVKFHSGWDEPNEFKNGLW